MFIFIYPLFAQEIILKDSYCIKSPNVKISDIDKNSINNTTIFSLPKNSSNHQIPTIKIVDTLKKNGYEVLPNKSGIIEFKRYCDFEFEILYEKLLKAFKNVYPDAIISSLKIEPNSTLPANIENFMLKNISVSKTSLKKGNGMILAKFSTPKNLIKSVYFKFSLEAKLEVYIAKENIKNGTILKKNLYTDEFIELNKVPQNLLKSVPFDTLIAKFNIKKGTILTKRAFRKKMLIKRGDWIKAVLKDGALSLEFEAKALSSGNEGDKIRVLTHDGKNFSGIVKNSKTININ